MYKIKNITYISCELNVIIDFSTIYNLGYIAVSNAGLCGIPHDFETYSVL